MHTAEADTIASAFELTYSVLLLLLNLVDLEVAE